MKKQIYDEKNGLSYTLHGDYYLPDLEINEEEPTQIDLAILDIMLQQNISIDRNVKFLFHKS